MKNKILLSALSESDALKRLNEMTGVENDKGVVFEVKDRVSSKIAIMGTNKIPEVHDLIGLGIVDDLEDSKLVTVYHPISQGMTETNTIIDIDHFDKFSPAEIEELKRFISSMPKVAVDEVKYLSEEIGKIGTCFSFSKPIKEEKITPNPASRQYKSKRK